MCKSAGLDTTQTGTIDPSLGALNYDNIVERAIGMAKVGDQHVVFGATESDSTFVPADVVARIRQRDGSNPLPATLDYTQIINDAHTVLAPGRVRLNNGRHIEVPESVSKFISVQLDSQNPAFQYNSGAGSAEL